MQPLSEKDLPSYYRARAQEYDAIYEKPERQADLRALETWLAPLFRDRRVLEIACGTGHWTRVFAPLAERVVALDAAAETLAIARTRVEPDKVRFLLGDAFALPAFGEPLDAAFAGFWFSHVAKSRLAAFFTGLHRRLQPGSTVVLLDNRYVPGSSTPLADRDAEGNTYQDRRLRDGSSHRVLKNFPAEAELRQLLHGLATHLDYREYQYYWTLRYEVSV